MPHDTYRSPYAIKTSPVLYRKSQQTSAAPVLTFTTSKAGPIVPTRASTPTSKLLTSANLKPSSSISVKLPAFSGSNASTNQANDSAPWRQFAPHQNQPRPKNSFFPLAIRPVLAPCTFAGVSRTTHLASAPPGPAQIVSCGTSSCFSACSCSCG